MSFHRFPRKWVEFAAPVLWSSSFVVVTVLVLPDGAAFGTRNVMSAQHAEPAGKSAPLPRSAPVTELDAADGAREAPGASRMEPEPSKPAPLFEAPASLRESELAPIEGPEPSPTSEEVPPPPPGPSAHTKPLAPPEAIAGTNEAVALLAEDTWTAQVDPTPAPSLVLPDTGVPSSGD